MLEVEVRDVVRASGHRKGGYAHRSSSTGGATGAATGSVSTEARVEVRYVVPSSNGAAFMTKRRIWGRCLYLSRGSALSGALLDAPTHVLSVIRDALVTVRRTGLARGDLAG